jgi:pyruvate ferredoxin oxidoreductase delta subunit
MIDLPITEKFCSNQDWRNNKPVWDKEKCVHCGICYLFCPDSAIRADEEGYYQAELE